MELDALGRQAHAHIITGDKAKDKAEQHYKSAGLYLIEAKARVERTKGLTWVQSLVNNCPVGKSRSYELIAIADGRKTVEEVRAARKERDDKCYSDVRRGGQSSPKPKQKQRTPVDEARDEATQHDADLLRKNVSFVKNVPPELQEQLAVYLSKFPMENNQ